MSPSHSKSKQVYKVQHIRYNMPHFIFFFINSLAKKNNLNSLGMLSGSRYRLALESHKADMKLVDSRPERISYYLCQFKLY